MKTVRIDQLTLGRLDIIPSGWRYVSEHPVTSSMDGSEFKTLEEAKDMLADECISPALDLFMQITGTYTNIRYTIKIQ